MNKEGAPSRIYDLQEAREKIRAYCAYRERSQVEVREKLISYGLIPAVVDELLFELIQENFLNEERFARAYVRGKFKMKKWGRRKIKQGLHHHGLSEYLHRKAFAEIDEGAYLTALEEILRRKLAQYGELSAFDRRGKAAQYAMGRGYEPELVWEIVRDLLPD